MKTYSKLQKISFGYATAFILIVAMNYITPFHDHEGAMFGLFHLDFIDDALHFGSALWALLAGLAGVGAVLFYFKWFGLVYLFDGVAGIVVGKGYLDLALFDSHIAPVADLTTRFLVNVPHVIIGGSMVLIGFVISKKWLQTNTTL